MPTRGLVDPSPGFEGRRVFVGEQAGDPVDGLIVYTGNLTIVPHATAVGVSTRGRIRAELQQ
jgi:hypothetical protein